MGAKKKEDTAFWIPVHDGKIQGLVIHHRCSNCGLKVGENEEVRGNISVFKHCPSCGKEMYKI